MDLALYFNMNNDAFEGPGGAGAEAARILEDFARKLDSGEVTPDIGESGYLLDRNGNQVGMWKVQE